MTSYRGDWTTDAEDALTLIWLQTYDPAVTAASNQIDRLLARDLIGHGLLAHELLAHEGFYKITEPPLTAYYSVDPAHNTVEVSAVRYTPLRTQASKSVRTRRAANVNVLVRQQVSCTSLLQLMPRIEDSL